MRFLIDENLSWRLTELLTKAGHDAIRLRDLDATGAPDTTSWPSRPATKGSSSLRTPTSAQGQRHPGLTSTAGVNHGSNDLEAGSDKLGSGL